MKIGRFPISYLPIILYLACIVRPAAARSDYAGWIEEIHGQAYWRPSEGGKKVRLDLRADQYRRLYIGDTLRCGPGATLKLRIYGSLQSVTEGSGWYRVPEGRAVPPIPPYGTPGGKQAFIGPRDAFAAQEMLNVHTSEYRDSLIGGATGASADMASASAKAAGASAGTAGASAKAAGGWEGAGATRVVFSPTGGSYVFVDDIVFRWAPSLQTRVNLAIEDINGKLLWQEEGVDGALGQLVSESARKVLRQYRDEKKSTQLRFVLVDQTGSKTSVAFSILAVEDEKAVRNELARWDGQQTVLRHLGRALVFRGRGMTFDAAQEYEAALASAPGSAALSRATMQARREAGMWETLAPAVAPAKSPN